jgi:hypothetical protein
LSPRQSCCLHIASSDFLMLAIGPRIVGSKSLRMPRSDKHLNPRSGVNVRCRKRIGPSRNSYRVRGRSFPGSFRRWATAGNVKLLLPPRQSRGASLGRLVPMPKASKQKPLSVL